MGLLARPASGAVLGIGGEVATAEILLLDRAWVMAGGEVSAGEGGGSGAGERPRPTEAPFTTGALADMFAWGTLVMRGTGEGTAAPGDTARGCKGPR